MSDNRGRGRGRGDGGSRGGSRGDRGAGQGRGGRGDSRGGGAPRGDFQGDRGGRGGGDFRGGGRGGRGGDGGGYRGRGGGGGGMPIGQGPPPGSGSGGIYLENQPVPEPSAQITKAEDETAKGTKGKMFPIGADGAMVPGRRGYGTKGTKIVLRTNYFTMTTAFEANRPEVTWYRYDVDAPGLNKVGDTPGFSRDKRRRLFDMILSNDRFSGMAWASDYAKIIVTNKPVEIGDAGWTERIVLPKTSNTSQSAPQGPPPDFVQAAQARNSVNFKVTSTGSFTTRQIIEYLRSSSAGAFYEPAEDVIQLFNIIMCKAPNGADNVRDAGRNRFYPHEGHDRAERYNLGAGLEAIRGYFSSVRPAVGRLLLNLNVTSGAFYKPLPLRDLIREFGSRNNESAEAFIRMLKVDATYTKDGQKAPFMVKHKKTIVGFARPYRKGKENVNVPRFGNARNVKFSYTDSSTPNAQPRQTSVYDYFYNQHGITLEAPDLPVLNVGIRDDPQYMPVELCTVIAGQPFNRLLNGDQTSEMLKFAARFPNLNAMSIAGTAENPGNGVRLLRLRAPQGAADPQVQSVQPWGVRVGVDMITVPGRILANPKVVYGDRKEARPNAGSWNLAQVRFAKPGRFANWQVLVINRQGNRGNALMGDRAGAEPMFDLLGTTLRNYGLQMGQRLPTQSIMLDPLNDPSKRDTNDRAVEQTFRNAKLQKVNMLFIVLPEFDRWLYARIKYYGDIKAGIHTINSIGSKLQKERGQDMYMGNLALKFNIKGGGTNHTVPNTLMKPLDNRTILFGIDVTHPSPGSSAGAPSIACVVASTDEHLTQWPGSVRTQTGRQEMVDGLAEMVVERLKLFRKRNNALPNKLILYRDGVSEGQYDQVLRIEVPCFNDAFGQLYGDKKNWPKMTVIVVGKRHHTRFYPTSREHADYNPTREKGSWNPKPGTIVDRHITGKIIREFYLQAHQGLQGTARPAHYVVLKDDVGFEPDEMEQFTHNLCYLFNRATKAVSICPPAYYADLLCERGRAYLFSTLAENHGSESSVFNTSGEEWTGGVNPALAESTWYI